MKVQDYLPYVTCAGVIGTAVISGQCTLKAEKILGERNLKNAPIEEKLEATWKCYIPVVAVAGLTIVSVIATKKLNAKELASVTAACGYLAQKGSVLAKQGKEIDKPEQPITDTGRGKLLCIEGYTGRLFWSSEEAVRTAVQNFNDLYRRDKYVCLNDFFELLGLETCHMGHQYGWARDSDWFPDEDLDIKVETVTDKDTGKPICLIDFDPGSYPMECWQEV